MKSSDKKSIPEMIPESAEALEQVSGGAGSSLYTIFECGDCGHKAEIAGDHKTKLRECPNCHNAHFEGIIVYRK